MAACLETLQSPTCCPALAPTLSRSQVQEKVEPRSHLSSPVSSQVNTKQILWINEFHSDSGEAVFVIIHIFILPIVQDIFENYYFNKRELNEPTYFSYNRHGKNSLLLWGEISHAHILNSQSPVSRLIFSTARSLFVNKWLRYQDAFILYSLLHYWYTILKSSPTRELCCEYSILSLLLAN